MHTCLRVNKLGNIAPQYNLASLRRAKNISKSIHEPEKAAINALDLL